MISWKSLKVLLLRIMSPDNNLLADILSGCPSLESLELCFCDNFDYIESESLRQLVITYYNGNSERTFDTLTISAPNLRSLQISEGLRASGVSLINSSVSLVNANINFSLMSKGPDLEASREMHSKCLQEILENLRHVKYLTIGSWCLEVLSGMEDVIAPFSNLACLTLKTPLSPYDLPGITRLLVLTPLLDTLIIEIHAYGIWPHRINVFNEEVDESEAENGRGYWVSQEGFMQEALRSLRRVNIVGFGGSNDEMEFIAFVLNKAEHLEKMIIQRRKATGYTTNGRSDAMWIGRIAERVLSFPRCSSTTVSIL